MSKHLHTVTLDDEKCKGCVACMKRCPTEAIRVRDGKAKINYDKCVSCGECVRICPYHAKKASSDSISLVKESTFKHKVALIAPSFYGQFENLDNINYVLNGLLRIGFDDVYEVAKGAELISELTRKLLDEGKLKKPVISTACPAVMNLILVRFHDLSENLLSLLTPADISAILARERAVKRTGLKPEEIGVYFISPCPAKVYAFKSAKEVLVDGVLSASEVYFELLDAMKNIENPTDISEIGLFGISWASSGGESASLLKNKYLAADGMENVLNVLKEMENGKLTDLDFVELNACVGGCVGGVLNIENPFVAKTKIMNCRKYLPISKNSLLKEGKSEEFYMWQETPEVSDAYKIDSDFETAMKRLRKIEKIMKILPMLDCGSCGAPSCRAFAEDVSGGLAKLSDCHRIDMESLI